MDPPIRSSVPALPVLHVEPEEPSGVEIMDVLRVLWRRRLALAVTFLALLALGYSAIGLLTKRYSGDVVLVLEVAKAKAVDVKSAADESLPDRPAINSEMDVFRSRGLAEQVVDKLRLTQDPEFNPTFDKGSFLSRLMTYLPQPFQVRLRGSSKPQVQPSPEWIRTKVVNSVQSALKVENDGQSNTVRLYYQATSPTTAAAVANAFADLYLQNDLRYRQGITENAASWIKSKLKELREQVTKADQAVQAFREQHQIIEVDHGPLIDQQLEELSRELATASATRMLRQSELEALQRAKGRDRVYDVPRVAASPLVQELRSEQNTLLLDRAELSVQLGPRHTRMVKIESRLREVQDSLDREVTRVHQEVETEARIAHAQEAALASELETLKSRREAADRASITLRQLTSEATSARSLFDAFVQGLGRNAAEVGVSDNNTRILSRAVPPLYPSFPPRMILLILTLVLSLVMAVLVVAVLEFFDRGYRNPQDLERAHGMPVLGQIPLNQLTGVGDQHPSATVINQPASRFADAVQTVCASLTCAQLTEQEKVVLVTSAVQAEGKTALAIALGRFAASNGKRVVLIDCDLRHPSVGRSLGQASQHGIVELWKDQATAGQVFHVDEPSGLLFIPASSSIPSPGSFLSSPFLDQLVKLARQRFDLVILDSPPVGIVSDAMMLSRLADATLLTVRWGRTSRSAVAAAVKRLATIGRPARAAVFSHVNIKRSSQYSYIHTSERYFTQ